MALIRHKPSAGGPPKPAPIERDAELAGPDVPAIAAGGSEVAQPDGPSSSEFHVERASASTGDPSPVVGVDVDPQGAGRATAGEFGPTKGFKANPLDQAVKTICEAPQYVTDAHVTMLTTAVPQLARREAPRSDLGDFDMREEIAAQLAVVRNLRAGLFDSSGKLMAGKDAREAREVITAASNLFSLLMKHEETLDRNARLQAIEQAVYETFEKFEDAEVRQRFLELLEVTLAKAA